MPQQFYVNGTRKPDLTRAMTAAQSIANQTGQAVRVQSRASRCSSMRLVETVQPRADAIPATLFQDQ